jgi:glutathione S-transferase
MTITPNEPLLLYRLHGCPYCERVVTRLDNNDIPFTSRFVEPLKSDRDIVKRIAGTREVPVIVDSNTGVTMAESANIVAYLESTYEATG